MENNSIGGENISFLRQRLCKICVVVILFIFGVAIYGTVKKKRSNKRGMNFKCFM